MAAQEALDAKVMEHRATQLDAQTAQLSAVAESDKQKASIMAGHNRQMEQQRADEDIQKNLQLTELRQRQNEVENFQLRPNQVLEDGNAFFKAAFLIKGALDGALSGFTGRPNEFGKFAEGLIKMGQDKQLAVFDKLKRAEAGQRNRMADYERLTGSKRAAMLQTEVDKISAVEAMLKQRMSELDAGTPDIKGAPSTMGGMPGIPGKPGIRSRAEQVYNAAALDLENMKMGRMREIDAATKVQAQLVGGGGGPKAEKIDDERVVIDPSGQAYSMPSGKEGVEVREAQAAARGLTQDAERLDKLRSDPLNFANPAARKEMNAIGSRMLLGLNKAAKAGALDKGSVEIMSEQLGDPSGITSNAGPLAKKAAAAATLGVMNRIHTGAERIGKTYEPTPSGGWKKKVVLQGSAAKPTPPPSGFKPVGSQ
jgi:hypothetical protein